MPTLQLQPRLHAVPRIEKRCRNCEPPAHFARVPAISVSDGVRCDACDAAVWPGESFWAVVIDPPAS